MSSIVHDTPRLIGIKEKTRGDDTKVWKCLVTYLWGESEITFAFPSWGDVGLDQSIAIYANQAVSDKVVNVHLNQVIDAFVDATC